MNKPMKSINSQGPSSDGPFYRVPAWLKKPWIILPGCFIFIGFVTLGFFCIFSKPQDVATVAYTIITLLMFICIVVAAFFTYDQMNVLKQQIIEMEKQRISASLWELQKVFSSDQMCDDLNAIFKRNRLLDGVWLQSQNNDKARRRVVHFLDTLGALVVNGGITIKVLKSWFSDTPVSAWKEVKYFEIEKEMEILQCINHELTNIDLRKKAEGRVEESPAAELVRMWNADEEGVKTGTMKLSDVSNQSELSVSAMSQSSATYIRPSLIAASTLVANLLSAIGVTISPGSLPNIGVFIMKVIVFLHGQKKIERLSNLVNDLKKQAQNAREQGTLLIDFNNPQNLENLFWKIEDFIEARDESKTDLLRRVAIHGLIKTDIDESQERDFRYAIKVVEIDDIDLMSEMQKIVAGERPTIYRDGSAIADPHLIRREEISDFSHAGMARLKSAGLLIEENVTVGDGKIEAWYEVTSFGKSFMEYLKKMVPSE